MADKIAVVLVTFNRLECLKKALRIYEQQTVLPSWLVVVNNASTDGTEQYLAEWQKEEAGFEKIVLNLESNSGGAGGFGAGLDFAKNLDAEWIWISDDDAYPEPDAIGVLLRAYRHMNRPDIGALFTAVINQGRIDTPHRRLVTRDGRGIHFVPVPEERYTKIFRIDQGSYVGMLVKRSVLLDVGTTRRDFFIYYDDTEHTTRIGKSYRMYCVPRARVHHDVNVSDTFSWKNYYGFRNAMILLKTHYGMPYAILEGIKRYVLFAAPWHRKYRREIRRMLYEGLRDGLNGKTGIHPVYKPGWKISCKI